MRKRSRRMFVAVLLAFVVQTKGDLFYDVVDLGTIPGCTRTRAYSVNNAGQVVGYGYGTGIPAAAIFFDSTGGGKATPLAPGEAVSVSYSINNHGAIAGRVGLDAVTWGAHAVGLGRGDAYAINDSGQVVGANSSGAVLFDTSGSGNHMRLGTGEATSINNLGQIVGHQWSGSYKATLFDPTGQMNNVALGGLPGYSDSFAFGINDSGQAVGRVWYGGSPYNGSAVLFDMTGGGNNLDLGFLPGSTDATAAFAINDSGQIVGSALGGAYRPSRAVLFDGSGAGENTDLNFLIDPLLGWELWEARSINDKGWIAGIGRHAGYETAFLLVPVAEPVPVPVPGAVLLGSLGLTYAGCLLRHRRVS